MGTRARGTDVIGIRDRLLQSQWWSRERFREHQLARLNDLIAHARSNSPFYRKIFEDNGLHGGVSDLDQLRLLPSTGKRDLIEKNDLIQNQGSGGKMIPSRTSGSTGEALRFSRSAPWDAAHRAAIARGYSWYGVEPWMRNGLLWGIPSSFSGRLKTRFADVLQNRFRTRSFDLRPDTLEDFYDRLRGAEFLEGYSSMIFELARFINENHPGDDRLPLRMIKGTSEKIYPYYQEESKKAFGMKIVGEYGAAETGIIAFECPEGSMHLNMEHVIVEVEEEEIIVTNLLSHSFPVIRYRLGDYVTLDEDSKCPCGRDTPIIAEITGRTGKLIRGISGATFPSLVVYYIIKNVTGDSCQIRGLQAVQEREGALIFRVAAPPDIDPDSRSAIDAKIKRAARRYFNEEIESSIEFVSSLRQENGKMTDFISHVQPRRQRS